MLTNGSPSQFFPISRGLPWDGPISPLMFLLVNRSFHKDVGVDGNRHGISIGRLYATTSNVSHFFANDTIIFYDNVCELIVTFRGILMRFEPICSQRVNLSKSSILPVGQVDNIIACRYSRLLH